MGTEGIYTGVKTGKLELKCGIRHLAMVRTLCQNMHLYKNIYPINKSVQTQSRMLLSWKKLITPPKSPSPAATCKQQYIKKSTSWQCISFLLKAIIILIFLFNDTYAWYFCPATFDGSFHARLRIRCFDS